MKKLLVSSSLLICLFAMSAFAQTPTSTKAIKKAEVKTETAKPTNNEATTTPVKAEKSMKKAKKEKKANTETK